MERIAFCSEGRWRVLHPVKGITKIVNRRGRIAFTIDFEWFGKPIFIPAYEVA
jgi:hypothetical protein